MTTRLNHDRHYCLTQSIIQYASGFFRCFNFFHGLSSCCSALCFLRAFSYCLFCHLTSPLDRADNRITDLNPDFFCMHVNRCDLMIIISRIIIVNPAFLLYYNRTCICIYICLLSHSIHVADLRILRYGRTANTFVLFFTGDRI